jgi:mannose-6-phosphate isomerase-like protein (cupin superfamily)
MKRYSLSAIPFFKVGDGNNVRYAQFMVSPEAGNHYSLSIDAVTLKPRSHTDAHIHCDNKEMMFFIDGGEIEIDGTEYSLEPRTLIIVEEGELHRVINRSDRNITLICTFSPALPKNDEAVKFLNSEKYRAKL